MAYEMAKLGPEDMDVAEIHDAFSIAEMMVVESLGFCEKGEGSDSYRRKKHVGWGVTKSPLTRVEACFHADIRSELPGFFRLPRS